MTELARARADSDQGREYRGRTIQRRDIKTAIVILKRVRFAINSPIGLLSALGIYRLLERIA